MTEIVNQINNTADQNHNVAETQGYIKILNDMIKDWLDLEYVLRILNDISDSKSDIFEKYNVNIKNFNIDYFKRLIKRLLELKKIISTSPDTDDKYIRLIDNIEESKLNLKEKETKIGHILAEINKIRRGEIHITNSFLKNLQIEGRDIPNLRRILKNFYMFEVLFNTRELDVWCLWFHQNPENPENPQANEVLGDFASFSITIINWECIQEPSGNIVLKNKPIRYNKWEIFKLKENTKVFNLTHKERNENIEDLISHEFIVTRWTYLLDDYLELTDTKATDTKAFFVRIEDKTTWKEYITYSI